MWWHTQVTDNARVQHEQTALLKTTMQSTDTTSGIWVHASSGSALNFRPSLVSPEALLNFGIVVILNREYFQQLTLIGIHADSVGIQLWQAIRW